LCIRVGGSITGEHGIGVEKRDFLPKMFSEADVDLMWNLRSAIDPQQIANRGKMFPIGGSCAPACSGAHPLERAGIISRE